MLKLAPQSDFYQSSIHYARRRPNGRGGVWVPFKRFRAHRRDTLSAKQFFRLLRRRKMVATVFLVGGKFESRGLDCSLQVSFAEVGDRGWFCGPQEGYTEAGF
jgi:hypothetical protein